MSLPSHAPERRAIAGAGTDEATWRASTELATMTASDVDAWAAGFARVWVVAPHPDDEVLALGGTISRLARGGTDVRIVSVTDGEASHGDSTTWTRERLAAARPRELTDALVALAAEPPVTRLGLSDGRVGALRPRLFEALADRVGAHDAVLVTCRFDGHPDHEACGDVAVLVGEATGATVVEYPVWMWHWAEPGETSIPWRRARRLALSHDDAERKRAAIAAFASQIAPDGDRAAVLPPHVLPRFLRPFEVVFA